MVTTGMPTCTPILLTGSILPRKFATAPYANPPAEVTGRGHELVTAHLIQHGGCTRRVERHAWNVHSEAKYTPTESDANEIGIDRVWPIRRTSDGNHGRPRCRVPICAKAKILLVQRIRDGPSAEQT